MVQTNYRINSEDDEYIPEVRRASSRQQIIQAQTNEDSGMNKPIGDEYDIYELVTRIHSPTQGIITRDFTLSDLDEEVLNAKLPKFIREQIKMVLIITDNTVISLERLKRKYNNDEKAIRVYNELKGISDKMRKLLMGELYTLVIMSRTKHGQVLKAILEPSKGAEAEIEAEENKTLIKRMTDKLTGKGKKE